MNTSHKPSGPDGWNDPPASADRRRAITAYRIGRLWEDAIDEFDGIDRRLGRLLAKARLTQDEVFQIATESRIVEDFPPASGSMKGEVFWIPFWTPADVRRWAFECGHILPEATT